MSCQSNSERGVEAGIKNGISRLAGKTSNVVGVIQSGYTKVADLYSDQVTRRMAPVTNSILSRVDRPSSKAAAITSGVVNSEVFPVAVTATLMLAPGLGIRLDEKAVRAVIKAKNDVGFAFGASKFLASMAAGLTQEGQGKVLTLKRGEKEIMSVSFVKSPKFSQFLNRLDLIGSSKQDENIISSSGDIVRAGLKAGEPKARRVKAALKLGGAVLTEVALEGIRQADVELQKLKVETGNELIIDPRPKNAEFAANRRKRLINAGVNFTQGIVFNGGNGNDYWHRGTTVFKTARGDTRTVTHLQTLGFPAQHYYFDRELPNTEVAEIITGMKPVDHVPGYVGGIHPLESLTPVWGTCKKDMITARLYYPPVPPEWVDQEKNNGLRP